jgi:hypothetical protein
MSLEKSFLISLIVSISNAIAQFFTLRNQIDDTKDLLLHLAKGSGFTFILSFLASYFVLNYQFDSIFGSMKLPEMPSMGGGGGGNVNNITENNDGVNTQPQMKRSYSRDEVRLDMGKNI